MYRLLAIIFDSFLWIAEKSGWLHKIFCKEGEKNGLKEAAILAEQTIAICNNGNNVFREVA